MFNYPDGTNLDDIDNQMMSNQQEADLDAQEADLSDDIEDDLDDLVDGYKDKDYADVTDMINNINDMVDDAGLDLSDDFYNVLDDLKSWTEQNKSDDEDFQALLKIRKAGEYFK